MAALAVAAVAAGGAAPAEAQTYANIVVEVTEYERTVYTAFDLVQMKLEIENLSGGEMSDSGLGGWGNSVRGGPEHVTFTLGGMAPGSDVVTTYYHDVSYADVRGNGGDISVQDCTSNGNFETIGPNRSGEVVLCFMVDSEFQPDAIGISFRDVLSTYSSGNTKTWHNYYQVVPFDSESVFCFVERSAYCNADNIQSIDGVTTPAPAPAPEPVDPPAGATLLHTIYSNHTGTLTMVFDDLVVAHNPDRIYLIHDIDAFIDEGASPHLGDSELYTVDGKRQSAVLSFALDDMLRLAVTESLRTHGDLVLYVDTRAVYAADGFVDITDGEPVLVPDIMVVR